MVTGPVAEMTPAAAGTSHSTTTSGCLCSDTAETAASTCAVCGSSAAIVVFFHNVVSARNGPYASWYGAGAGTRFASRGGCATVLTSSNGVNVSAPLSIVPVAYADGNPPAPRSSALFISTTVTVRCPDPPSTP